jgi:hypothetical protein
MIGTQTMFLFFVLFITCPIHGTMITIVYGSILRPSSNIKFNTKYF